MYKDMNKCVQILRDNYFDLEENKRDVLQHYVQNLSQNKTITDLQLQQLIQEDTGIVFTLDNIKYVMLLNNYIPNDMHSDVWQFNI